jgi:peptidoglycan/xylan/chitin deacetylase (PgdA/CDA1 family)
MIRARLRAGMWSLVRRPRPAILMYHRVATPPVDPWGLSVAPDRFRDQLAALVRHRVVLSMEDYFDALKAGRLPAKAVSVTFDDGYRDNLEMAQPILGQFGLPATVFLTAAMIGSETPFWWDELAGMILVQPGPIRLELTLNGQPIADDLPALAAGESPDASWRAWDPPRTVREAAYRNLWQRLQRAQPGERAGAMEALRRAAPSGPVTPESLPMSRDEVSELASRGIDIGAHAMTHQPLTALPSRERDAEILGSRTLCTEMSGRPIAGFAYPHGDRDAATIATVEAAGFGWACSTRSAAVDPARYDRYDLPRIVAPDVPGSALLRLLAEADP